MKARSLTQEYLPAFIYLIDLIDKNLYVGDKTPTEKEEIEKNPYQYIADRVLTEVHERTIRRTFELRENLKKGKLVYELHKTSKTTLNLLTVFHLKKEKVNFSKFETDNKNEIAAYYEGNKPTDEIIAIVFTPSAFPKKIVLLQEEIKELKELVAELKGSSLEDFIGNEMDNRLGTIYEDMGVEDMQSRLMDFMEMRLTKLEKKLRRSTLFFRFFGLGGLFFMSTTKYEDIKGFVLEAFADDYELDMTIEEPDDDDDDDL